MATQPAATIPKIAPTESPPLSGLKSSKENKWNDHTISLRKKKINKQIKGSSHNRRVRGYSHSPPPVRGLIVWCKTNIEKVGVK